jgi:hypothetical protein
MVTGDSFFEIMNSLGREKSIKNDCIENPSYEDYVMNGYKSIGCGNKATSITVCIIFSIVVIQIFLNLFIAIILEGH